MARKWKSHVAQKMFSALWSHLNKMASFLQFNTMYFNIYAACVKNIGNLLLSIFGDKRSHQGHNQGQDMMVQLETCQTALWCDKNGFKISHTFWSAS